jgi:outer membrane lipoprotein carrier protein
MSFNYIALIFIFIGFFIYGNNVHAEEINGENDLNNFLQKIETKASTVEAFSCNFEQQRHLSIFSKPILFYGTLSIDRPDKMRWEITKPVPSVMLLDGEKGLHCSGSKPPRKFNTVTDPIMKIVSTQLWSWLSGDYLALRENYTISTKDNYDIILEPKEKGFSKVISSVLVQFSSTTLQPKSVTINEAGQDRTEIFFSDYILNTSFPYDHFSQCFPK